MNKKNKKGISLIVLTITIAIMTMLIATVTFSGIQSIDRTKKIKFATELSLMEEMTNSYILNNNGEYPVSNSIVLDVSKVSLNALTQFEGETQTNSKINLYEINSNLLGKNKTVYGNKSGGNDDVFAISKDTKKVYYIRGLKVSGSTYYTLNDELKKVINYSKNKDDLINGGIIFTPSKTQWTNEKISAEIKVPSNYIDIVVKVVQIGTTDVTLTGVLNNDYYTYNAKALLSDSAANYDVVVTYKLNSEGNVITQKFSVKNYDGVKPILNLSAKKQMDDGQASEIYSYISVLNSQDNNSGIKVIKYENIKLDSSQKNTYFKTSGIECLDNNIKIKDGADYVSVYVEDNAGNFEIYEIDL